MAALGKAVSGPGRIYLTGGATAVLYDWRQSTIDIDMKADPEPAGLFEAIVILKETLAINIELAAPDDFIPALPGWRERSLFITRSGELDFLHYDPYAQVLSKVERGHARDLQDVEADAAARACDTRATPGAIRCDRAAASAISSDRSGGVPRGRACRLCSATRPSDQWLLI